jgi:hypothetical protein
MIRPGQRTGYSSHVDQYARDWRWKERVTALDQYLDQKADEVRIASLQADARDAIEYQRTLRANRAALAGRLRERIMAMATAVNSDGSAVAFDSNEAKAQRDVVLAVERLQLIEDGCVKGLEPIIAAYTATAVPCGGTDAELPATIPADVAASVLALLSAVGNAGE